MRCRVLLAGLPLLLAVARPKRKRDCQAAAAPARAAFPALKLCRAPCSRPAIQAPPLPPPPSPRREKRGTAPAGKLVSATISIQLRTVELFGKGFFFCKAVLPDGLPDEAAVGIGEGRKSRGKETRLEGGGGGRGGGRLACTRRPRPKRELKAGPAWQTGLLNVNICSLS